MATVFRRSAIDWNDFPREMEPAYDLWLAYLASRDGAGAYYLPQRLTRYRVHPSAESALRRHDRALVYCYDRFLADERLRPIHHELRRVRARFHTGVGIMLLSEGERLGARNWFRKALGSAPDLRAVLGVGLSLAPGSPARFLAWFRRARSWLRRLRRHPTTG